MVVNGVRFDESNASIVDDEDQIRSRADLRIGTMVRIEGSADDSAGKGSASRVVLMPSILGMVDSVNAGAGTLVVLGQTVRVDANTSFDGTGGLAAMVAGDIVRVHGLVAADGTFAATLIEKLRGQLTSFRVRSIISAVDPAARRFTVGALKVDYASAELRPTGAVPTVGALVKVSSDQAPVAGVLSARKINIYSPRAEYAATNGYVEIKGILDAAPDATGKTTVSGIPVILTGVTLEGSGNLVAGQRVEIKGVEVNGVIQVSRIQFEGWHASKIGGRNELYGEVANFTSPSNFTVNGVTVDASGARFENGTMNNLAEGIYVEIKGNMGTGASGSVLIAAKVEFKSRPRGDDDKRTGEREFYGPIENFKSIADFTVNGIRIDGSGAKIDDGRASDLRDGVFIEVEGRMEGDTLIAKEIEIKGKRGGMTPGPVPTTTTTSAGTTSTTVPATTTSTTVPATTSTTVPATTSTTVPATTSTTVPATTSTTVPATTSTTVPTTTSTTVPTTTTTTTTSTTTSTTTPGPSGANGKLLYQAGCASSGCHGPNVNLRGIQNGTTAGAISSAISSVGVMNGLSYSPQQLADLAAYIANPSGF